jgi:type I restriction enzyme M protein
LWSDTLEPEEQIDIAAVQLEIVQIEAELDEARAKMRRHLKEPGIDA